MPIPQPTSRSYPVSPTETTSRWVNRPALRRVWVSLMLAGPMLPSVGAARSPRGTGQEPACPPTSQPAQVTEAYKAETREPAKAAAQPQSLKRDVKLRDIIVLRITNLNTLLAQKACAEKDGRTRALVLYLDAHPLKDVSPYPPTDPAQDQLMFPLHRTEASREAWTNILGKPRWTPRLTNVSVGLEDGYAIPSEANLRLRVLPHAWFIFWFLLIALVAGLFIRLAYQSDMVRDGISDPRDGISDPRGKKQKRRAYSLARVQASWWFFWILASYLLIGLVTGDFTTSITGTVLVLLGISGGTAVGSAFIDASKEDPEKHQKRKANIETLTNELRPLDLAVEAAENALKPNPNDPAAREALANKKAERESKAAQLRDMRNESVNFLQDILSDANGVNFHRFQMAAWTVVLTVVFVTHVYRELAMPQFNETLLALLGISAGTFLTLKLPEPTMPKEP